MHRGACSLALSLALSACGHRHSQPCLACLLPSTAPPQAVRAGHEERAANPQCELSSDCQLVAHATEMVCHHDGTCMPVCASNWGDCNNDMSDGCEASISHPIYCNGDPRISEERTPTATLVPVGEKTGPGTISSLVMSAAFDRSRPLLVRCYEQVLASNPEARGTIAHRLMISADGCITAKQMTSDANSPALEQCVKSFFTQVRLSAPPAGGATEWTWEVVLSPPSSAP